MHGRLPRAVSGRRAVTRPNEPAEHDAHLRSALRHAPDAALVPSDALNEAILQRARLATAPVSRPSLASAGADVSPGSNGRGSRAATPTNPWDPPAPPCASVCPPAVAA